MSDQRNTILFIGLSVAIIIAWMTFFPAPKRAPQPAEPAAATSTTAEAPGIGAPAHPAAAPSLPRDTALTQAPRVPIDAPKIIGSLSLKGARIDDVRLRTYFITPKPDGCKDPDALKREAQKHDYDPTTFDPETCQILLLNPRSATNAYYADFGWSALDGSGLQVPGPETIWSVESGTTLRPGSPVTLRWDNGAGLIFRQTVSVDDNYLFEIKQSVENTTQAAVTLGTYGRLARHGLPKLAGYMVVFEGATGSLDGSEKRKKYKEIRKAGQIPHNSTGGWLGITDKYWLSALVPPQDKAFTGTYAYSGEASDTYQTTYQLSPVAIAPNVTEEVTARLFAGAKEVNLIEGYEKNQGIQQFGQAIDWGTFNFLTQPLFHLLDFLRGLVGNFGIAILLTTLIVKAAFFPLASRSYETMSKMKKLQPEIKEMQERYKDDRVKLQQEMMELYRKEKLNPLTGCLPVLLQIPVFFSLYKVLFVSIEMRHAPFFGWIHDLSAKDPTSFANLFGLLPYDPSSIPVVGTFLMIGIWPIIMGLTMFVQTSLNPAPQDPTQKMIFTWMPVMFTFMLAAFPVGLVIYWSWNNALSILQQYFIMKRNGTEVSLLKSTGLDRLGRAVGALTGKTGDKSS